jgi:excisionase family DNA binding protein
MRPLEGHIRPTLLTTLLSTSLLSDGTILARDKAIMNAQHTKEIPIYLTLKELAEMLKVKPRTIYAWVSDKRIPFERKGGLLRFRLDAVVAWNEPAR